VQEENFYADTDQIKI
jgi:hypothetical protein